MTFAQAKTILKRCASEAQAKQKPHPFGHAFFWATYRPAGKVRFRRTLILCGDGREDLEQICVDTKEAAVALGVDVRYVTYNLD